MPESKRAIGSNLAKVDATTDEDIARQIAEDPDTAPELTDAEWDEGEVWEGDSYLGRAKDFENGKRKTGRPKGSGTKELVTLRLDREILDRFRAGGPGWQTRLNNALLEIEPKEKQSKMTKREREFDHVVSTFPRGRAISRGEFIARYRDLYPDRPEGSIMPHEFCSNRDVASATAGPKFLTWLRPGFYQRPEPG